MELSLLNDAMNYGRDEIKLKVNSYGESLGLNEQILGVLLSNAFLERRMSVAFDSKNLLELKIRSAEKDSLSALKNFPSQTQERHLCGT